MEGRAWSGFGSVEQVEFSWDGGRTWEDTELGEPPGSHARRPWSYEWDTREPGEHELCARATDASGRTQPTEADETWNYGVNVVQRVPVIVGWFWEPRLARAGMGRDTFAMTEEEIRERVREILLKQALGEDLTQQEETILAYAYYAAGEQSVRMWVRPDAGAEE